MKIVAILISMSFAIFAMGCAVPIPSDTEDINQDWCALETYALPDDSFVMAMSPYRNYLIVVNADHSYRFGSVYDRLLKTDIVYLTDVWQAPTPVEKATACAFTQLQQALHEKGIDIGLQSAYRTKKDQQWILDHYKGTDMVLRTGFSEHHTGLVLDIMVQWPNEDGEEVYMTETPQLSEKFADKSKILHQTLADFGFIDRYPVGKEEITGLKAMPNEIRFVGSSKIAHEIMDNNLALEEYLYYCSCNK